MLTFYDEKGNGYGAQVEFTTKNPGLFFQMIKYCRKLIVDGRLTGTVKRTRSFMRSPKTKAGACPCHSTQFINSSMISIIPIAIKFLTARIASKSISRPSLKIAIIDTSSKPKRTLFGKRISGTRNVYLCLKTLSRQPGSSFR